MQRGHRSVDFPYGLTSVDQFAVQVVRAVIRQGLGARAEGGKTSVGLDGPGVGQVLFTAFGKVSKSDDVADFKDFVAVIGDPDLDIFGVKQGVDLRQVL